MFCLFLATKHAAEKKHLRAQCPEIGQIMAVHVQPGHPHGGLRPQQNHDEPVEGLSGQEESRVQADWVPCVRGTGNTCAHVMSV